MSDEIQVEGKSYISSKRASELSGYAQDYIGQLSRKSLIDARRIGGLWYVSMESLENYREKAAEFKPQPPARPESSEPGTLIFFDGKQYLSAAHAAEQTGYTQDYVGQLARAGTVLSQQVGNRWYVERESILGHKKEKDALLGAVQSEAVGIQKRHIGPREEMKYEPKHSYPGAGPLLNYFNEESDLMPVTASLPDHEESIAAVSAMNIVEEGPVDAPIQEDKGQFLPIRRISPRQTGPKVLVTKPAIAFQSNEKKRGVSLPLLLTAAATIVIVISAGYASTLRQNSVYAIAVPRIPALNAMPASVGSAFSEIAGVLEPLLTHQLTYQRSGNE
jgi:hypothetical protein